MPSIESTVFKVVVDVSDQLSSRLPGVEQLPGPAATTAATDALFADLDLADVQALEAYLTSPAFAIVVAQKRLGNIAGKVAKDQLHEGLRLAGMSAQPRVVDILHDVMIDACQEISPYFGDISDRISRSDLYAAATTTGTMLGRVRSSARIHHFAARMRDQVAALHNKIRMPHIGVSRSVRYEQLYVEPTFDSQVEFRLGAPGERVLVQGDPGAGKSTLAAKFAHDVATDGSGRVPFLLVLRQFTTSFDEGGRDLPHYLEKLCQEPYNVKPPRDGVEYLLRTGRAVVILDGLDELVQTELRRRVVSLAESFAHLYPLVPILVTARKVGYEDAPLSTDLFVTAQIKDFDDDQVADYVSRWFKLDDATVETEQDQLIRSFLEDSEQIRELRSNALLLTLLCAMYSSDRHLPHNLAQVYERCALMLFEQWDSKRGIDLPIKFHGRLRGAVQHLAWRMFSAAESGKPLTRTKIVNNLAEYLDRKLDDHDESVAMAEEFLEHCTGRAWILADVGANESEPQFGFTHRTFLEYFAAEYLVRTHRTAEALWAVLKPHIGQWDVVAQIVLQLYDRNIEGGAEELLSEALEDGGLGFAARALHHVVPSDRIVRTIAVAALEQFVRVPASKRFGPDIDFPMMTDEPLSDCLLECSPANRQVIMRALDDHLGVLIAQAEIGAVIAIDSLYHDYLHRDDDAWSEFWHSLLRQHGEELLRLRNSTPWTYRILHEPGLLKNVVLNLGATALFTECSVTNGTYVSSAYGLVNVDGVHIPPADVEAIAIAVTNSPTPWVTRAQLREIGWSDHYSRHRDSLRMLVNLPYLEKLGTRALPDHWRDFTGVSEPVRDFLLRWERGEVSVLAQDPQQPPPLPAQH